ncbi:MAG: tRNA lysidine(34) synthetase TilS [Eubacteriales bacterium]
MEEKIKKFMEGIPRESKLLLAVSGGKDSMAMYHFLLQEGYQIAVAHFDHQSRQGQSTVDGKFLKELVERDDIPFYLATADVEKTAKERGQGFEECARELRYGFLEETARENMDYILTAHHAGDNLETFLFHLCRGTGLRGLSGISPQRGNILRPLLAVTEEEIVQYIQRHNIPFRQDESNFDLKYKRNFLRHQIIPNFSQINPRYLEHSVGTIALLQEENQFLDSLVEKYLSPTEDPWGWNHDKKAFSALAKELWGRGIHWMARKLGEHLSPVQTNDLKEFLEKESPPHLILSPSCRLYYQGDRLYWERGILPDIPEEKEIFPEKTVVWGRWQITLEEIIFQGETGHYLKKQEQIFLRPRQEGDKIPVQNRANYKVKKYLQMMEIPPWERNYLPIFRNREKQILALGGLVIAEPFLPQVGDPAYHIKIVKNEAE